MFVGDYISELIQSLLGLLKENVPFRNKVLVTVTIVIIIALLLIFDR